MKNRINKLFYSARSKTKVDIQFASACQIGFTKYNLDTIFVGRDAVHKKLKPNRQEKEEIILHLTQEFPFDWLCNRSDSFHHFYGEVKKYLDSI
ncbi:MAG: hypothetical protein HC880_02375 [Bacteroidia bacterium]|nr:hypothetical protein [Bacteroidia bacterium]